MVMKYEKEYDLRTSDFDCRTKLTPAAILDLFQDVAGRHAEELGIGREAMLKKQVLWVVVKVKLQVIKDAEFSSRVKVETWPIELTRASFQREYCILNEAGEILVKGSSEWVLMHSEKRRLIPIREVYPYTEFIAEKNFEGKFAKNPDFEPNLDEVRFKPSFTDIDMNLHVNNTKYVNFVLNAVELKEDEFIDFVQIDYSKEVQRDAGVTLLLSRSEKEINGKGMNEAGEKMFSCRIILK